MTTKTNNPKGRPCKILIDYQNEKMSISEAIKRSGSEVPYRLVYSRIVKKKWTPERALSEAKIPAEIAGRRGGLISRRSITKQT